MKRPTQAGVGFSSELSKSIAQIHFPSLVAETHAIIAHKTLCPFHQDTSPSCHVYNDGYYCYACGAHGDALDWLKQVYSLSKSDATKDLENRIGVGTMVSLKSTRNPQTICKSCDSLPIPDEPLNAYAERLGLLDRIPKSLEGRGFLLEDLWALGITRHGEDALIPILDPKAEIVRIKRRHYQGNQRYSYTQSGSGTPAWCSFGILKADTVLICEGELNAMACWLACPELGVMGIAGTHGCLWTEVLKDKKVYVYADRDVPGQEAREKWALAAFEAGAKNIFLLDPLPDLKDFCDIAGQQGRDALRELLPC